MDTGGGGWLATAANAYDDAMRGGGGEPALRIVASVLGRLYRLEGATHRLEPWLEALDRELAPFGARLPPLVEPYVFVAAPAVLARRPAHPGLPLWYARALSRLRAEGDEDLRLVAARYAFEFAIRGGNFREADLIVAVAKPLARHASAPLRVEWLEAEALHAWLATDHGRARDAVNDALALGGGHGIHVQALSAALSAGDPHWRDQAHGDAHRSLDPARRQDAAHLAFLAAGIALLDGRIDEARARILECNSLGALGAPPYFVTLWLLGRAHVRVASGDTRGARRDLANVVAACAAHYWRFLHFSALATRVWLDARTSRRDEASLGLREALAIARAHGYRNADPWWNPAAWKEVASFARDVDHDRAALGALLARVPV